MRGGKAVDPKINGFASHVGLDAAVLRDSFLGDVHFGHDFKAADHRCLQPSRRPFLLVADTVDSIAHPEPCRQGLKMNIGRTQPERLHDHGVH